MFGNDQLPCPGSSDQRERIEEKLSQLGAHIERDS
jgi:hypothetical protein